MRAAIFVLTLLTWCQAFAGGGGGTGCATGAVIDNNGAPVAGIGVRLISHVPPYPMSGEVFTDKQGNFEVTDLAPATYKIFAAAEKVGYPNLDPLIFHRTPTPEVVVEASNLCSHVTVDVGSRAATVVLNGRDAVTNKPLGTLAITYGIPSRPRGQSLFLHESRNLLVPSLTTLLLDIDAVGYQRGNFTVNALDPDEVRQFDFTLEPIGLGCLSGVTVDDKGVPVDGIKIQLLPLDLSIRESLPSAMSDLKGRFVMNAVQPAPYDIMTEKDNGDYLWTWAAAFSDEIPKIEIRPSGKDACQNIVVHLGPKTARLTVYAFDNDTGDPVDRLSTYFKAVEGTKGCIMNGARQPIAIPSLTDFRLTVGAPGYEKAEPIEIPKLAPGQSYEIKVFLHRSPKS